MLVSAPFSPPCAKIRCVHLRGTCASCLVHLHAGGCCRCHLSFNNMNYQIKNPAEYRKGKTPDKVRVCVCACVRVCVRALRMDDMHDHASLWATLSWPAYPSVQKGGIHAYTLQHTCRTRDHKQSYTCAELHGYPRDLGPRAAGRKLTHARTHTRTHATGAPAPARSHTHARTLTRTYMHVHTHTRAP